jgi:small subunit ribosomal protein S6
MPLYQITAITRAGVAQPHVHGLLTKLSNFVLDNNGVVAEVKNWGEQRLAYRMRAHQEYHTHGRIVQLRYVLSPTAVIELQRLMKLDPQILRFMAIREKKTSIAMLSHLEPSTMVEVAKTMMTNIDDAGMS